MVEPFREFAAISNPPETWTEAHAKIAEGCNGFADALEGLCDSAEGMLNGDMTVEDYSSAVTEYTTGLTEAATLLTEGLRNDGGVSGGARIAAAFPTIKRREAGNQPDPPAG